MSAVRTFADARSTITCTFLIHASSIGSSTIVDGVFSSTRRCAITPLRANDTIAAAGTRFDFYYGGRTRVDLVRSAVFESLAQASGGSLISTTEDGSAGERGLITAPLVRSLAAGGYRRIFTCGPMGLMQRLAELGAEYGVPGEAALETPMGCGFGACLGCAVELVDGRFALCCKDGPVFAFDAVKW